MKNTFTVKQIVSRAGGIKAVAAFTGKTDDNIRKWIRANRIPAMWHLKLSRNFRVAIKHFHALEEKNDD